MNRLIADRRVDFDAVDGGDGEAHPAETRGDGVQLEAVDRCAGCVRDGHRRVDAEGACSEVQADGGVVVGGQVDACRVHRARDQPSRRRRSRRGLRRCRGRRRPDDDRRPRLRRGTGGVRGGSGGPARRARRSDGHFGAGRVQTLHRRDRRDHEEQGKDGDPGEGPRWSGHPGILGPWSRAVDDGRSTAVDRRDRLAGTIAA